jgi:cysteine desulfurase/selenocysteine lyase
MRAGSEARRAFPIFENFSARYGRPLSYLDSAASAQKPRLVLDRLRDVLSNGYANIHRGAYELSARLSDDFEEVRDQVATLLGAKDARTVVFVRGATEGINLVARGFDHLFNAGDSVVLTLLEHHSNIVPWQMLAARCGVRLHYGGLLPDGEIDIGDLERKIERFRPKIVAVTQLANSLGTIPPLKRIIDTAHSVGARVLVDGCQGICHLDTNVTELGCDFYVFSAHKLYGPTGVGALYGTIDALQQMEPLLGGGNMIEKVAIDGTTYARPPQKFEAGTLPIAEVIALGAAIEFFRGISAQDRRTHEHELIRRAVERLRSIDGVQLHGPVDAGPEHHSSILSFTVDGVHPHDLATMADGHGVCLRAGHHCAQPALDAMGLPPTARISFGVYSVAEEIDALERAIYDAKKMFIR